MTHTPIPSLPRPIPFRLGVTSYVYPADILTNIQRLAPVADDIEVVFFESSDFSSLMAGFFTWRELTPMPPLPGFRNGRRISPPFGAAAGGVH